MPERHALLGPSSAHRWLNCAAAPRLEEHAPNTPSVAAQEGTQAHSLAEAWLNSVIQHGSFNLNTLGQIEQEMVEHVEGYVNHCLGLTDPNDAGVLRLVETELDLAEYAPESFGTADYLAADFTNRILHMVDFKYGQGVLVTARENPQLKMYALGALGLFDFYDFNRVTVTIYQPRRDHVDTWETTPEALKAWGEGVLKPAAELAWRGTSPARAGDWCRFCRIKDTCRARAWYLQALDFKPAPELTDDEIEELLPRLSELQAWASSVQKYAQQRALNGHRWRGFKLVPGKRSRKWANEAAASLKLREITRENGLDEGDLYTMPALKTVAQVEKLVGRKQMAAISEFIEIGEGAPSLVDENDRRKEWQPVTPEQDFKKI